MVYDFGVEDPIQTLSALARPGKALALEAQIELWSATKICRRALFSFRQRRAVMSYRIFPTPDYTSLLNGNYGWLPHTLCVSGGRVAGGIFVLTAPFIELRQASVE